MKNIFAKLGRFFWSWRFLKFILWFATLVVFFYAEENWRGSHAWAATKAEWEAKGESFDYDKLIPPTVPDDQNLAAIPLFKLDPDSNDQEVPAPLVLEQAVRRNLPGSSFPKFGNWQKGEVADMEGIRQTLAADYAEAFETPSPSNDTLARIDALYPCLADLRAAALVRPLCRFDLDYTSQPPYGRGLRSVTIQLTVAKLLALHAIIALNEHQSELALSDITTLFKLSKGVGNEPLLISGLVALSMNNLGCAVIWHGLETHAWSDSQLVKLDEGLASSDPLSEYQLDMRGELVGFSIPTLDYLKKFRPSIHNFFAFATQGPGRPGATPPFYASDAGFILWPGGWLDLNKGQLANTLFACVACADVKTRRVWPDRVDQLDIQIQQSDQRWDALAPWNLYDTLSADSVMRSTVTFAHGQAWMDEARIACALERHRLAHGAFPGSLDELTPTYLPAVPRDVVNGDPYRYQLRPDGYFLLYSVGWNLKDDGGVAVFDADPTNPDDVPQKHGDWVWPVPQAAAK